MGHRHRDSLKYCLVFQWSAYTWLNSSQSKHVHKRGFFSGPYSHQTPKRCSAGQCLSKDSLGYEFAPSSLVTCICCQSTVLEYIQDRTFCVQEISASVSVSELRTTREEERHTHSSPPQDHLHESPHTQPQAWAATASHNLRHRSPASLSGLRRSDENARLITTASAAWASPSAA